MNKYPKYKYKKSKTEACGFTSHLVKHKEQEEALGESFESPADFGVETHPEVIPEPLEPVVSEDFSEDEVADEEEFEGEEPEVEAKPEKAKGKPKAKNGKTK